MASAQLYYVTEKINWESCGLGQALVYDYMGLLLVILYIFPKASSLHSNLCLFGKQNMAVSGKHPAQPDTFSMSKKNNSVVPKNLERNIVN